MLIGKSKIIFNTCKRYYQSWVTFVLQCVPIYRGYPSWRCYSRIRNVDSSVTEFLAFISNGRSAASLFQIILILLENQLRGIIGQTRGIINILGYESYPTSVTGLQICAINSLMLIVCFIWNYSYFNFY